MHKTFLGIMSELLIRRGTQRDLLFEQFKSYQKKENFIATDDERFISNMYDVRNFKHLAQLEAYFQDYKSYFSGNDSLKKQICDAFSSGKKVFHKIFNSNSFINDDLGEFLSYKENKELRTECLWNVTLFYNQITQNIYRPIMNTFFGGFNQELAQLHHNVEKFIDIYLKNQKADFEKSFKIAGTFSNQDLLVLNKDKRHSISINGRLDIYKPDSDELFEIKASFADICPQGWIIQTLCYALLLDIYNYEKVQKMYIVNILRGKLKLGHSNIIYKSNINDCYKMVKDVCGNGN